MQRRPSSPANLGLITLLSLAAVTPAAAQNSTNGVAVNAPAVATRAPQAPIIDGRLDDDAWNAAAPFAGFTQRNPNEGEPGTERTDVRVLYTDDAIYVGVRAYDSRPDAITGILTRRDEWSPSDWIGVAIDSYRDRRTAFGFFANAVGVKRDVYFFDDNDEDATWEAIWQVGTTVDAEGWTAEFRIPFSQLRFSAADRHEFGFNVYRRINRLNEEQYWRLPPKNQSGVVSRFGDLVGIEGIEPPRRVEIMPYVAGNADFHPAEAGNPFLPGEDQTARVGADFNIGVTSNLTLSATVNPDFGQVEADPAVVNLSAFESFFPEKRPFFNEGIDIFRFGLGGGDGNSEQLFYTRRIGRAPQGSADPRGGYAEEIHNSTILGAGKLSGKTPNGWTIGLLGALTGKEQASVLDGTGTWHEDVVEPQTGYFVGRLAKDFRAGLTQVGLFGTGVNRQLPEGELQFLRQQAYTVGLNWNHRFANDQFSVGGFAAASHVSGSEQAIDRTQRASARYYQRPDADHLDYDPTRTSLSGFTADVSAGKHAGNWRYRAGYGTRSPGFEVNDLGFQQSADWSVQWTWVNRRWLQPGKLFRRFNLNFNQWYVWDYSGARTDLGGNINVNFALLNYWEGYAGGGPNFESLGTGRLRGGPAFIVPGGFNLWGGFESDDRRDLRAGVSFFRGTQDQGGGDALHLAPSLSWRAASNVDLRLSPSFNRMHDTWQYLGTRNALGQTHYLFGDLKQTTLSMTFRGNMTFSPGLSLQVYAQPFVASGDYRGVKRVSDPRGETLVDRFDELNDDRQIGTDGEFVIDLDRDGAADIDLGNPDFTVFSFRSNVVLRWEYSLGSTLFLVWQHGRSGYENDGEFSFGPRIRDLFRDTESRNTFVVKLNYWLSL